MKKIELALLLSVVLISSCSLFQSKDRLLTKSKWIATQVVDYDENGMIKWSTSFKKEDDPLTIKFEQGGVCFIKDFKSKYIENNEWNWSGNDKEYIVISDRYNKATTFKVNIKGSELIMRLVKNKDGEDINIINYDTNEGISLKKAFHFDTK